MTHPQYYLSCRTIPSSKTGAQRSKIPSSLSQSADEREVLVVSLIYEPVNRQIRTKPRCHSNATTLATLLPTPTLLNHYVSISPLRVIHSTIDYSRQVSKIPAHSVLSSLLGTYRPSIAVPREAPHGRIQSLQHLLVP